MTDRSGMTPEGVVGEEEVKRRERRAGLLLGFKLHLIAAAVLLYFAVGARDQLAPAVLSLCLWQWLYLVPAIVVHAADRRNQRAIGIFVAGVATMGALTLIGMILLLLLCANLGR